MLMSCLFLQAAQHFLELDFHHVHQLKDYKNVKKARKADVKRLNAEVSSCREALSSREKKMADLKSSHLAEVNSLKNISPTFKTLHKF